MSRQTAISNFMPVPVFHISYSPIFVRGAKREIRENGKLLYSSRQMRIRIGSSLDEKNSKRAVQRLEELGYKNVKAEKSFIDLPRKCPSCQKIGSPSMVSDKRYKVHEYDKPNNTTILRYNHPDKKTCYIGKLTFSKIIKLTVKDKIKKDTFSLRNRIRMQ